jgi:hypothetical protein
VLPAAHHKALRARLLEALERAVAGKNKGRERAFVAGEAVPAEAFEGGAGYAQVNDFVKQALMARIVAAAPMAHADFKALDGVNAANAWLCGVVCHVVRSYVDEHHVVMVAEDGGASDDETPRRKRAALARFARERVPAPAAIYESPEE